MFAKSERIRFRADASNEELVFLRNRIRHRLLPLLRREYQPGLDACVLRLMEIATAESDFLEAAVQNDAGRSGRARFSHQPVAIQRRALRGELIRLGITPSFELVEGLRAGPPGGVMIQPGLVLVRERDGKLCANRTVELSFQSNAQVLSLSAPRGKSTFAGVEFAWRRRTSIGRRLDRRRRNVEYFDAEKIGPKILLRHWRAGDRYHPIGMKNSVKLQDWFTNLKVPRAERRSLVVAEGRDDKIFWVEGRRISDRFKLEPTTVRCLEWRWKRQKCAVALAVARC